MMNLKKANDYIERLYEQQALRQKQYMAATPLADYGPVIDDDVARMLQVLITLAKPQHILEIGTSVGFSTVAMAKAVQGYGGRITSIEFDANVAAQAVQNFTRENVAEQIDVVVGDARTIIPALNAGYDLIFQDVGDKELYAALFEECVRLLNPGGLLVAEDTLLPVMLSSVAKWQTMRDALAVFNEKVAKCDLLESTLLPIGDGFTIAVKRQC